MTGVTGIDTGRITSAGWDALLLSSIANGIPEDEDDDDSSDSEYRFGWEVQNVSEGSSLCLRGGPLADKGWSLRLRLVAIFCLLGEASV